MSKRFRLATFNLLIISITLVFFTYGNSALITPASAGINENFEELSSGFDWAAFFLTEAGVAGNVNHFGAYAFEELDGDLLIGVGRARPAETSGSMLVKFDGTSVTNLGLLNEQGFGDMVRHGSTVVIAGVDPAPWPTGTPPQLWSWGNVYITDGTGITKYREDSGLDGVIHAFSISRGVDGTLYMSTGSQDGTHDNQTGTCILGTTCYGEVFKSTNGGSYWESLGQVAPYRNFDILEFGDKLFTLSSNNSGIYQPYLQYSSDQGANWATINFPTEIHRTHMVEFNGQLLTLGYDDSTIYGINSDLTYDTYTLDFDIGYFDPALPTFRNYKQFVVADDGYLYTIERGGKIMRSSNLIHWDELYDADKSFVSIGYWPSQNAIILGERGTAGSVWKIDIDDGDVAQIFNLASGLNVINHRNGTDLQIPSHQNVGHYREARILSSGNIPIADIDINMLESRDWSIVNASTDIVSNRSFAHNLATAPGSYGSFDLYVPKASDQTSVMICPGAVTLSEVTPDCVGGVEKYVTDLDTEIVTIDTYQYWKVSGLEGTGGISLPILSSTAGSDQETDVEELATTGNNISVILVLSMPLFISTLLFVLYRHDKCRVL